MQRKLKCILIDDDPTIFDIFTEYLRDNEFAEIIHYYQNPKDFISSNKKADLLFIDIMMPDIDGFTLAHLVKPTPVILFTGKNEYFKEILNELGVIDAFAKPITKDRLIDSIIKAHRLIIPNNIEKKIKIRIYWEFNTLGSRDKIIIKIRDIIYVKTHHDPRNKLVYLADGTEHIIMNYSMNEILEITQYRLFQPNHSELVSKNIIIAHGYDHIYIKIPNDKDNKMVTIGYHFSKIFKEQLKSF